MLNTTLIAQSVCRYSLRIPPRPKSLLLRSTQLVNRGEVDHQIYIVNAQRFTLKNLHKL